MAVDGWDVTFGTARKGLNGAAARPGPLLLYQNVTAHPSTASVPITVLLYNGQLNVPQRVSNLSKDLPQDPLTRVSQLTHPCSI